MIFTHPFRWLLNLTKNLVDHSETVTWERQGPKGNYYQFRVRNGRN